MSASWPGEEEIMDQWNYAHGEAPTLEFTREYPASVVSDTYTFASSSGPRARVTIFDIGRGGLLGRYQWSAERWDETRGEWRAITRSRWYSMGESYVENGCCRTEEKAIRKGKAAAMWYLPDPKRQREAAKRTTTFEVRR